MGNSLSSYIQINKVSNVNCEGGVGDIVSPSLANTIMLKLLECNLKR